MCRLNGDVQYGTAWMSGGRGAAAGSTVAAAAVVERDVGNCAIGKGGSAPEANPEGQLSAGTGAASSGYGCRELKGK